MKNKLWSILTNNALFNGLCIPISIMYYFVFLSPIVDNDWPNYRPRIRTLRRKNWRPYLDRQWRQHAVYPGSEAHGNLSEGGLPRLIGGGFKKGCVLFYYSSTKFESTLVLLLFWTPERGRSCCDVLYRPCHLEVSFFLGVMFTGVWHVWMC